MQRRNYTSEKNRRNDPGRNGIEEIMPTMQKTYSAPGDEVGFRIVENLFVFHNCVGQ